MTAHTADVTESLRASYEAIPYEGNAITGSHPNTLATAARLRGMSPPPVGTSRVLELGAGRGDNLVPMALSLPNASFVGVDLSPRQVEMAREFAQIIGVSNVRFEALSISDIDDSIGEFDYILCHGVYSWVPPDVQEAILRVSSRNLAPQGVAYVSYNCQPGWYVRGMVRDMILFHDDASLPPRDRVNRARSFIEFLARSAPETSGMYRHILNEELATLRTGNDSYFLHEELESINEPLYFTEFIARAARHGLRHIADAEPASRLTFATEVHETIATWTRDEVVKEQYLDLVRNRTFRRSILCHDRVKLTAEPTWEAVPSLFVSMRGQRVQPDSEPAADGKNGSDSETDPNAEVYRSLLGAKVTIAHPVVLAALHHLIDCGAFQNGVSFDDVVAGVASRLDDGSGSPPNARDLVQPLADALLHCSFVRLVDFLPDVQRIAWSVAERPVASPVARLQAHSRNIVTCLRHHGVDLSPLHRLLVLHADGTRDRAALCQVVVDALRSGALEGTDLKPDDSERIRAEVEDSLTRLLVLGLFMP
jgi:SAM-dependent methyltransferase